MNALDLDLLERLEREAVPAPWEEGVAGSRPGLVHFDGDDIGPAMQRRADQTFVAALRNAAPALIARIRELEAFKAAWTFNPKLGVSSVDDVLRLICDVIDLKEERDALLATVGEQRERIAALTKATRDALELCEGEHGQPPNWECPYCERYRAALGIT